jgi:hypothetical protein
MANTLQWKPEASYYVREGSETKRKTKRFNTYRELQKEMRTMLEESTNNEVCVSRSRRGEWGEWHEEWRMTTISYPNNRVVRRPVKYNETWL